MTTVWIIGKFLDDETLLEGGNAAVRRVVAELGDEACLCQGRFTAWVYRINPPGDGRYSLVCSSPNPRSHAATSMR
jgi:hypothetical protein